MNRCCRFLALTILATVSSFTNSWLGSLSAQEKSSTGIVTFTMQEDHQNMLKQLGITKLRPGPSGNESAPNHANYDEALVNPYPDLPELLLSGELAWRQHDGCHTSGPNLPHFLEWANKKFAEAK